MLRERKDFKKPFSVWAVKDSGVDDRNGSSGRSISDEPADTLSQLENGFREGVLCERVTAVGLDPLAFGINNGMIGVFEGKTSNNNLGEGGARNIYTCPEAVSTEKYSISIFSEAGSDLRTGTVFGLDKEGSVLA